MLHLLLAELPSPTQGVRVDSTGIPDAQDICSMPRLAQPNCNVFSRILVIIPSVSNVQAPNMVIKRRDLYITTRIKDKCGNQLGGKLRTNKGTPETFYDSSSGMVKQVPHSFQWKQAFVIPVTCPQSWTTDDMYHLEVNLKDEKDIIAKLQVSNKEVAKATLQVAMMPANGTTDLILANDIALSLRTEWCDDMACVDGFISKTLGMTFVKSLRIQHEGIDCGAGCHSALENLRRTFVVNAMNNSLRKVERYAVYDNVVDDPAEDEENIEDSHVFWETYVEDWEKKTTG